ncbi:PWI domain-containing protein [Hirsutella rhossiliensis]|uniref:PWI domain-containing protein n=1 Tax=Hirsutella rhossiliensis TaxID=111463 RepID=A0A9P8N5V4_9HYPO|nr:PWI domain-containing protein [Hirsutella rhossiliensis]KAH0967329.1 PWI domain-containing protein [Hirsutella rhossiliensis]
MASKVDARLLKSTKFPSEFNQKVDTEKVNLPVMKKWIAKRICEILGSEDDVLIELCCNLIEGSRYPDIKSVQIQITGFLDKDTAPFCKDLWNLLLSAQSSSQGVPKELLEAKKLELMQGKMDADRENTRRGCGPQDSKEGERRDSRQVGDSWHAQGRRGDRRGARDSYGRDSYVPQPRRGRDQPEPVQRQLAFADSPKTQALTSSTPIFPKEKQVSPSRFSVSATWLRCSRSALRAWKSTLQHSRYLASCEAKTTFSIAKLVGGTSQPQPQSQPQ